MFKNKIFKSSKLFSSDDASGHKENHEHKLLSVKLYLTIFFILLFFIFVNMVIGHLNLPSFWSLFLLMSVALVQTVLVAAFFMELIHEDKFFSFVFGSAVFFLILFFFVTLNEINGRDFFDKYEGVRVMREVDKNGDFAPQGPKPKEEVKEEKTMKE